MAFNVTQFTAALPKGGARSGLFRCTISIPTGLSAAGGVQKSYALTAHAASIPASTIEPTDVSYFGRTFRIPGTRTFEDWTTTVYTTEDFAVRDMFEEWSAFINDHDENIKRFGVSHIISWDMTATSHYEITSTYQTIDSDKIYLNQESEPVRSIEFIHTKNREQNIDNSK